MRGVLRRAGEHGLDPEDYGLSRLDLLGAQIGKGPIDDAAVARLADFDLLMTAAFFRYASDLSTGRVHPDEIRNDWHTNLPELDPLTKLNRALGGARGPPVSQAAQPRREEADQASSMRRAAIVFGPSGDPSPPEGQGILSGPPSGGILHHCAPRRRSWGDRMPPLAATRRGPGGEGA